MIDQVLAGDRHTNGRGERPVLRIAAQGGIVRGRSWSLEMDFASRPLHCEDESVKRHRAQDKFIARVLRSSEDARRAGLYLHA